MPYLFFSPLFGAPPISLEFIHQIEKKSPNIIIWAAPVMFLFVVLEWYISYRQDRHLYNKRETIGSILVGIGNVLINLGLKLVLFYMVIWIYNRLPWRMFLNWWTFIPCYIIFDFCSYWSHRVSHQQRFWWATHVVHHSGENYNLTVSFRLSWVQNLKIIFFLPVALIGFHPVVFFVVNQVAVLFNFGYIQNISESYILRLNIYLPHLPITGYTMGGRINISTKTTALLL